MTWVNKAIDKRIQDWKGATTMEYNPLLTSMDKIDNNKLLTRRLLENSIWYSGNEQDLSYFYRKEAKNFWRKGEASESLNYFWANLDTKQRVRKIHTGIPQLISEKMVDLIVGNGYEIKVEGKNEVEIQEDLDEGLADNKFKTLVAETIENESWSGGASWKLSYNPDISKYPIIELWQPENYTNKVVSGRIVEDIFYVYYNKGKQQFRLCEKYGVDKEGSYIDYELQELIYTANGNNTNGGEWVATSLSDLEETKDLKRITFKGYNKKLSLYKPNKTPNSEFRGSVLGESDYAGSYGAFDALDEIASTWIQEFRDGKLNRYFPEELMLKRTSGDYDYPDDFTKDHILYADSPSENVDKQKIQYAQGDVRTEKHVETWKIWITTVLNNSGLSPLTVGVTGLESISASETSQQEREKTSIRTRNKKIEVWKEFLEDILARWVEFRHITKNLKMSSSGVYTVGSLPDVEIKVTFNDYIVKSKRDRTEEVQAGLGTSWDILTGVQYVHDDKTEREQLALSARIKIEQGFDSLSQAELSALQAENLENNDIMQEQGVDIVPVNENTNRLTEPTNEPPLTEETEEE